MSDNDLQEVEEMMQGEKPSLGRTEEITLDVAKVSGIGEYESTKRGEDQLYNVPEGKVFLVMRLRTIEVRCDSKLGKVLREKYETVMESRYFGRGGVEVVLSGQLEKAEIEDLVRLSYNLTKELSDE